MPEPWQPAYLSGSEDSTDRLIARLASAQWGVVARRQLLAAGLSERVIHRRLTVELLVPLHRGVYGVGHERLRREGWWLAAVLAVGPGAVLSHRDAAGLHGIRPANHRRPDVSTTRRVRVEGIAVHRTRVLASEDVTTVSGIPVTTIERTLVDLAGVVAYDHIESALRRADDQQALDPQKIRQALDRTRHRQGPGHKRLTTALAEHEALATTLTRSALEASFQRLIKRAHLPQPRTNIRIEGYEVDAVWADARVVAELDGWEFHKKRHAFERDRARDTTLAAAGWHVIRFTHRQIVSNPEHVIATLHALTR